MVKLTEKTIPKLEVPSKGQRLYWDPDCRGLAVKVLHSGTRSFVCRFTIAGKRYERVIGPAGNVPGAWSIDKARRDAAEMIHKASEIRRGNESIAKLTKPKDAGNPDFGCRR